MLFRSARFAAVIAGVFAVAPALAQTPTMSQLWPNSDGLTWIYLQHYEDFTDTVLVDNRTRIYLDGTVTAPTAIDAQYLHQDVLGTTGPATVLESTVRDPFLRLLWKARPDLRAKIVHATENAACPETGPDGIYAVLLGGEFAFRKTPDEIAAWRCNLADTRAWIWLVSNLTIGNTFTLQLVPDLADDIFLRGTVAANEPIVVPAGSFDSSIRVDYVIDYGEVDCVDDIGNPTGTFHSNTQGHIHFVPDIGPVESSEDFIPFAQVTTGTCAGGQVGQVGATATLRLESLPTPVRTATWGRLKALYR